MKRKAALITGGTRGIGLAIAQKLADEGWDLAINGIRSEEEVAPVLKALQVHGNEVLYCRGDIGDVHTHEGIVRKVLARLGRLNLLVNNAGIAPMVRADLLDMTEESYDRVMGVNLKGPFFLTQRVARNFVEAKEQNVDFSACIINISSVSATVASTNRGEYCLSKAGASMSTQLFAVRLGESGIPVYEVRPGVIRTDMTSKVTAHYDAMISDGLCVQPRWGEPADVAKAVAALARGDFPYSTGQIVMVDGGLTLSRL